MVWWKGRVLIPEALFPDGAERSGNDALVNNTVLVFYYPVGGGEGTASILGRFCFPLLTLSKTAYFLLVYRDIFRNFGAVAY